MTKPLHEQRILKVELTEEELKDQAQIMAKAIAEVETAESEKKAVTSQFKARIDEQTAVARSAGKMLQNGYDYRSVECEIIMDDNFRTVVRTDTGEIVESRPLNAEERQLRIEIPE